MASDIATHDTTNRVTLQLVYYGVDRDFRQYCSFKLSGPTAHHWYDKHHAEQVWRIFSAHDRSVEPWFRDPSGDTQHEPRRSPS